MLEKGVGMGDKLIEKVRWNGRRYVDREGGLIMELVK